MMPLGEKAPSFLKNLFRSDNRKTGRSELVIFITPKIMDVDRDVAGNRHLVTEGRHDAKQFFTGPDRIFEEKGKPQVETRR